MPAGVPSDNGTAGKAEPFETTDAVSADADGEPDEDDGPQRTLDELRTAGDATDVDRQPVLGPSQLPVKAGEWPLGYPVLGVPRLAAVLNLNYIYDESRGEWVRQKKSDTGTPEEDETNIVGGGGAFYGALITGHESGDAAEGDVETEVNAGGLGEASSSVSA